MTIKPIIGIVATRNSQTDQMFIKKEVAYVNESYVIAISRNGGNPIIIPYTKDYSSAKKILEFCDGIVFPGGTDIDPKLYDEHPSTSIGPVDPELDDFIYEMMKYSLDLKKPILAICKGMQMMNIILGGSIYQDLSHRPEKNISHLQLKNRSFPHHEVYLNHNTKLREIFEDSDSIYTNSLHHQAIKEVGGCLRVSGVTADELIEAVEDKDGLRIGVQWHPEDMVVYDYGNTMNKLFKYFVDRSKGDK